MRDPREDCSFYILFVTLGSWWQGRLGAVGGGDNAFAGIRNPGEDCVFYILFVTLGSRWQGRLRAGGVFLFAVVPGPLG